MEIKQRVVHFIQGNKYFLTLLASIIIMRSIIIDQYQVPSGSMIPTIQIGDRLIVSKMAYQLRFPFSQWILAYRNEPQRGDIVVFDNPVSDIVMVKRLIGLPGDKIVVKEGELFVNGNPVKQSERRAAANPEFIEIIERLGEQNYLTRLRNRPHFRTVEFDIPEGEYFFLGDNRDNSKDSRAWGTVPRKYLKGRALTVSFALDGFIPIWERFGHPLYRDDL